MLKGEEWNEGRLHSFMTARTGAGKKNMENTFGRITMKFSTSKKFPAIWYIIILCVTVTRT